MNLEQIENMRRKIKDALFDIENVKTGMIVRSRRCQDLLSAIKVLEDVAYDLECATLDHLDMDAPKTEPEPAIYNFSKKLLREMGYFSKAKQAR